MQQDVAKRGELRCLFAGVSLALAASACAPLERAFDPHERFAVYYDQSAPADAFARFDTVVLDGDVHPDLNSLKDNQQQLIGYISVGEIKAGSPVEQRFDDDMKISTHPYWKSTLVDIRRNEWQEYLLSEEIPALLAKGFDGVMLDTIDSALYQEVLEPKRYAGMKDAAAQIVKQIRSRYPHITIMVNRAFDLMPLIAADTDILLAESTLSHYDLSEKRASFAPDEDYAQYLAKIRAAQGVSERLKVYTLDYWDMNDPEGISKIYELQRKQGFVPYVATPDLRVIYHESKIDLNTAPAFRRAADSRNYEKGSHHA